MNSQWIKQHQPTLYRILQQSIAKSRLSHAFLLIGDKDLIDIAQFMSGVIYTHSIQQEEIEDVIHHIELNQLVDVKVLDGFQTSIKKEEVIQLQHQLSQSATGATNRKVVIIHHCDNASTQALNSLLKMIEEPVGENYFILTTNNVNQVLPTIVSRCINIQCENINQDEIINEIEEQLGMNRLSAYYLSTLTSQINRVESLANELNIETYSMVVYDFFHDMQEDVDVAIVNLQLSVNDRESVKAIFQMMIYGLSHKVFTIENSIAVQEVCLQTISKINRSVYVPLLIDQFAYQLKEVIYV